MVAIDIVVHRLFKEPIIGSIESKMAEVRVVAMVQRHFIQARF